MKLFEDFYVYPWLSYQANNCNTIFIDGDVPSIIDPGHSQLFNHVIEGMSRDGKIIDNVSSVICTHCHPDHIEAIDRFDDSVIRGISKVEHDYLNNGGRELFIMTGCPMPKRPFQVFFKEGILLLGDKRFTIIPTPGHSPGSICLYWEDRKTLISGDTIFAMGVGRTDFTGGDIEALRRSIEILSRLDIEYLIPGHGELLRGKDTIVKNFDFILGEFFG